MAADPELFEHLVRELAQLAPDERARLVAEASHRAKALSRKPAFHRPTLRGGTGWIGGELGREELSGDDGR